MLGSSFNGSRTARRIVTDNERLQETHDLLVALGAECGPACPRRHAPAVRTLGKADPDDPVHPGWPAGAPDGKGGRFRPKGASGSESGVSPADKTDPFLPLDAIPPDAKEHPVPLLDSSGQPVLDDHGRPILRPAHLPPELFVRQGLAMGIRDRLAVAQQMGPEAVAGVMEWLAIKLRRFGQGGPWDAQRIGGKNVREYRDYATVAIGLYCAAAGISIDGALSIQDDYAALHSRFDPKEKRDERYTHLPERNVADTKLGYALYESGRIRPE